MAVLVTGAGGYIGSHMLHELLDAGESVVALDNLSTGFRWAIPERVPFHHGDVGDAQSIAKIISDHAIDAIIHFAASVVVPESMRNPLAYYRNNTVNSRALIETAIEAGMRHVIFSSTAAVYGNPKSVPITEDAPTDPISPYGSSKLMAEMILRDAGRAHGLGHVILRYFNVAGADPQLRAGQSTQGATHLIKVAAETAVGRRSRIEVFGTDYATPDGSAIRDYIHVTDLVRAHSDALRYLRGGGAPVTLNCGYGHGFSVLEVIDAVKKVSGANFAVTYAARRPGDPERIVAATDRARAILRWRPQFDDLATIVAHALAWERRLIERGA